MIIRHSNGDISQSVHQHNTTCDPIIGRFQNLRWFSLLWLPTASYTYLGNKDCNITPLLMFLEGRAIVRVRARVIPGNMTFFSDLKISVGIGTSWLWMSIILTEQAMKNHVALMGWVPLTMTSVTLIISPLWFDILRVGPHCEAFFNYSFW